MMSREGVFLVNNLLLTVLAFVVLIGTLFPMLVEAATGEQVGVGRPFFDRMAVPLFLILLVAMALGPVFPYRAADRSTVWSRIRSPLQIALLAAAGAVVPLLPFLLGAGRAIPMTIALSALALFTVGCTLSLFTGRSTLWSGLRMVLIGGAAGTLTWLVGSLLGV